MLLGLYIVECWEIDIAFSKSERVLESSCFTNICLRNLGKGRKLQNIPCRSRDSNREIPKHKPNFGTTYCLHLRVEVSKNGIETFNSERGEREKDHGE